MRRTWLVGADLGWNPVNNLNFDLELMYQGMNSGQAERVPRDCLQHRRDRRRDIRAGRLARQQRRFRRPLPHHPLLLIAFRSVDLHEPRSESSGVFCWQYSDNLRRRWGARASDLRSSQSTTASHRLGPGSARSLHNDRSKLWATKLGLENCCTYVVGDMFKQVPPADAYSLQRILHDWSDTDYVRILSNIRKATSDKGRNFPS